MEQEAVAGLLFCFSEKIGGLSTISFMAGLPGTCSEENHAVENRNLVSKN
ncbi:hypothetical protein [Paenibacillus chitinolyticus]